MAEEDLDLVIHLGDYIYEYGVGSGGVRNANVPASFAPECVTLERYRLQHSLYKTDPDLQEAHRMFPWIVTWDDHEVANDYSGIYPEFADTSPAFLQRRAAAYQAYFENMPVPLERAGRGRRTCSSTGGWATATSPISTCSTRASTARTTRAATASSRPATPASTRTRR